jgi:hypothetical protein
MISYINFTMFHIVFRVRRGRDRIVVYYYQIICVVFFVNRETKLIHLLESKAQYIERT